MDHKYGIAVQNKFNLFDNSDDERDPLEMLRESEEQAKNAKKDDKKKGKSAKKAGADTKPKPQEQLIIKKDDKPSFNQSRGERGGGRGGRGRGGFDRPLGENERPPRRQGPRENRGFGGDENVPPEFRDRGDGQRREGGFGERGRGRGGFRGGRGGPRGGRGGPRPDSARGGGGGFGAPRQFDRRSGDDRTEENQAPAPAEETQEFPPAPEQPETTDLNESGEAKKEEEEEEAKEMTLEEWKALQNQSRMKTSFNIRKAGEGVDDKQWKKGVAYKKVKEEEEEESEEEEEEEDEQHGKKKLLTEIKLVFADQPRRGGRGGRGGRGRGDGDRGGRGAPRGGRGGFGGPPADRPPRESRSARESAPRIENEEEFPSLK